MGEKIAIIGGGMAGLTTAYLLNKKHDIKLFEKDERLGGNAHTLSTSDGLNFDIAVAVFGKNSYPNFRKLLKQINVETNRFPDVGMGWRNLDTNEAQYIATTPKALIAQKFSCLHPRFVYQFLSSMSIVAKGKKLYAEGKLDGLTMSEAFDILPPFKGDLRYMLMFGLCLVSSMYYEDVMAAPANFFFGKITAHPDFFENPLFNLFQTTGNTKSYVDALASHFNDKVVLNSKIKSVQRNENEVILKMAEGGEERFDKVVFACNADQALKLLEKPTADENRLLGPWRYNDGPIVVHQDRSSYPKEYYNLFTWLYTNRDGKVHTSVNGHIRSLKSIPDDCKYISSQHPNFPIDKDLIEFSKVFRTPIYDTDSVATIKQLPTLNGIQSTYYCGSHFGYGLHEDCVNTAIEVAKELGVEWD